MDRDATFLLALISLAAAALAVGVAGWVLFVRDHRAWKTARAGLGVSADQHPPVTEDS
jgi:hypothetical protein